MMARLCARARALHIGFTVAVAALTIGARTAPLPEAVEKAASAITSDDLRAHLRFLASDELQGRGTGHQGNRVAELYLASVFERLGLQRAAGAAYLQPIELYSSRLGPATELVVSDRVNGAEVETRQTPGSDFYPYSWSAARSVSAPIAFVGYGITAPEYHYDDYAGIDVTGRIVVALDGEPQNDVAKSRFLGRTSTRYAQAGAKLEAARTHGAVGLLIARTRLRDVKTVWPEHPSVRSREFQLAGDIDAETVPVAFVSMAVGDAILARPGAAKDATVDVAALRKKIDKALDAGNDVPVNGAGSVQIAGRQARLVVDLLRDRGVVHNVLGAIEGDDPKLKSQLVVIGAHLDHEGIDEDGRIYNGADDDGSGTVAVLGAAEAFADAARNGRRPSRTVVFALWNGEEKGELGSRFYLDHPAPAGTIVANVNMDMIGRDEDVPDPDDFRFMGLPKTSAADNTNTVHLLGYSYSPDAARIVREENTAIGLVVKSDYDTNSQNLIRRSDDWPFLQSHIPSLSFTTGLHPDYHTPQDDVGRINFDKLEKIARLAFRVTWRLANDAVVPRYEEPRPGARGTEQ